MTQPVNEIVPTEGGDNPHHVAIIMDGNNRWAKQRGLPGPSGHKAGVEALRTVMEACEDHGIRILTVFAFSSENWRRPPREVEALMTLFSSYLKREMKKLKERGVRLRVIGSRERFSPKLLQKIEEVERYTADQTEMTLALAVDYGGQWDIAEASRQLACKVQSGQLDPAQIDEHVFQQHLALGDLPMPDLLVRTGGEFRISNFLLWQAAYAELYFTDTYWPDFDEQSLADAVASYQKRQRRFGQTGDQVESKGA